ncbi:MAG: tetratricopeptide repeat protein [Fuerstiella sp.]
MNRLLLCTLLSVSVVNPVAGQESRQFIARKDLKLSDGVIVQAGDLISGVEDGRKVIISVRPDQPEKVSRKDLAELSEALEVLEQLIRKNPEEAHYYSARANVRASQGDLPGAVEDATRAIEVAEQSDSMTYVNRGTFLMATGDTEGAVRDFVKATHLDPQNYAAYTSLAAAHNRRQEYDRAIAVCNSVLEVDAQDPAHYVQRGVAYRFLEQWDKAVADFSKALELQPNHLAALGSRGFVYYLKGDHALAVKDFDAVIQLQPNDAMAFNNRGYNQQLAGNYQQAIADFDRALELNPKYTMALQNKAWLLATCPDDDVRNGAAALEAAKKAIDQRGTRVAGDLKALAAAYAETGDFENAIKHQQAVVDMTDADSEAKEKELLQQYRDKKAFRFSPATKS